jgi:hypothetical protein
MREAKCKLFESKLTNGQLILINKMIADKKLNAQKEQIIGEITMSRTGNVRELFVNEATDVIRFLKNGRPAVETAVIL